MEQMNTKTSFCENDRDFYLVLGDFLDAFYRADNNNKKMMIENPPDDVGKIGRINASFLASAVHKLANDNKINPPEWVFDKCFYLDGTAPFFGCRAKGQLRQYYLYTSPPEFKHRNLFVDANVLERV